MATKKTTGKKLADMMYGNPEGAAFGFFPQLGRRGQAKPAPKQAEKPFIDQRAMELPQFGEMDLDVPTAANRAMGQRMVERDVNLKRQADRDMSPLEKLAGGIQTGRLLGSALTQSVKSIPTAITKGGKAAEDYIAENIYQPTQPKAYEYAGNIADFLTSLESDYKIPPIIPEAMVFQNLMGPATRQAGRAAQQGALAAARAGERLAERAVPQIMERGGAGADILRDMAQGSQSRIFIGPKAKTFHKGKADMAVALEEAGRTPQEIWQATGTFRGKDGILRQEIDDRAANLILPDEQKDRVDVLKNAVEYHKGRIKPTTQKDLFPKALTEAKKGVRSNIDALKEEISGRSKNPRTQGIDAQYAFDHPELYEAYPELRNLNITMGGREGTASGASGALTVSQKTGDTPGYMEMDMYNRGLMSKNPTSVALHEMQHAVQTLEGMGPGGSPTFAFQNPEAFEILKKLREEAYKPASFEDFQRVNKFPEDEAQSAYEQYVKERKENPITSDKVERALQERAAMEYYKRLAGEAEARAVQDRQMMTPAQRMEYPPASSYDVPQEDLIVKPPREYADGGRVHFSDNPDVMQLELAKGGAVRMQVGGLARMGAKGATKGAAKAAKVEKELALPPVLPRAPAKTKEEIRPYAQRMAQQMTGEFYRPNPKKSENVAGKSFSQFKMEKGLEHDIRPTKQVVEPEVADIEKQLGMLKIGISGDTTIADKVLHRAGPYELFDPSPQHGGPRYGLGGEGAWASNNPIAANVQKRVNELSGAYGAPPLGQYMAMGPQGSNFAQHFADANLQAIDTSAMTKSQIEQINKLIREGSQKSGPRPSFPGIEDRGSAYLHFAIDPELRKHFNDLMQKTSVTEKLNLPDGRIILHAITEPELRDKEILNTGFSQMRLKSAFDPESLQISTHPTYSHVIPHEEGSAVTRTKYLTPGELEFSDVLDYAKQHYRPQDMTRVFQTSTPRQIVDPQHIDEMKMYEELMKEYTGKKAGGAVRKAAGGEITADDLILEERKL
jgi:hypothetical protein